MVEASVSQDGPGLWLGDGQGKGDPSLPEAAVEHEKLARKGGGAQKPPLSPGFEVLWRARIGTLIIRRQLAGRCM